MKLDRLSILERDFDMKKRLFVLLIVLMLLATASILTVSAKSDGPIDCVLDITWAEHDPGSGIFYWDGTLADCELEGKIRFDAVSEEYAESGKALHFVEVFTIWPDSGGEIYGKNWGVWNFSTFKFRANGWVRDASEQWEHLIGSKYHEIGTTSPYFGGPGPIFAPDGDMKLVPAKRQPHALP
jgi:hypothetical protein